MFLLDFVLPMVFQPWSCFLVCASGRQDAEHWCRTWISVIHWEWHLQPSYHSKAMKLCVFFTFRLFKMIDSETWNLECFLRFWRLCFLIFHWQWLVLIRCFLPKEIRRCNDFLYVHWFPTGVMKNDLFAESNKQQANLRMVILRDFTRK